MEFILMALALVILPFILTIYFDRRALHRLIYRAMSEVGV